MANAAATLVGQNLGAGFPDRAEKSVWTTANYNLIFLILLAIIMGVGAEPITHLFSTEPEVVKNSVISLRIICLSYVFFAHGMVVSQAFNGAGDTKTPTVVNFFAYWLVQIPLSYLFAITFGWGPAGVYVAVTISAAILAAIFVIVFRRGKWKQTTI
jgi:Na+-driven multidrug efflux pump